MKYYTQDSSGNGIVAYQGNVMVANTYDINRMIADYEYSSGKRAIKMTQKQARKLYEQADNRNTRYARVS